MEHSLCSVVWTGGLLGFVRAVWWAVVHELVQTGGVLAGSQGELIAIHKLNFDFEMFLRCCQLSIVSHFLVVRPVAGK